MFDKKLLSGPIFNISKVYLLHNTKWPLLEMTKKFRKYDISLVYIKLYFKHSVSKMSITRQMQFVYRPSMNLDHYIRHLTVILIDLGLLKY